MYMIKDIKWDTDGDMKILRKLPVWEIPPQEEDNYTDNGNFDEDDFLDDVSDWLSNTYGFCHGGFRAVKLINTGKYKYYDVIRKPDVKIIIGYNDYFDSLNGKYDEIAYVNPERKTVDYVYEFAETETEIQFLIYEIFNGNY